MGGQTPNPQFLYGGRGKGLGFGYMPIAIKCKKCGFLNLELNKEFAENEIYFHYLQSHGCEPCETDYEMWVISKREFENARTILALTRNKVLYSFKLCLKK